MRRPEVLAERFASDDDHRPAYGDSTVDFLAAQAARREPWLTEVHATVIDVDDLTKDEAAERAFDVLADIGR